MVFSRYSLGNFVFDASLARFHLFFVTSFAGLDFASGSALIAAWAFLYRTFTGQKTFEATEA